MTEPRGCVTHTKKSPHVTELLDTQQGIVLFLSGQPGQTQVNKGASMKLVNLCHYPIVFADPEGNASVTLPSSGDLRVPDWEEQEHPFYISDPYGSASVSIPLFQRMRKTPAKNALPPQTEDTLYYVSQAVAEAFPERTDFCYAQEELWNPKHMAFVATALYQIIMKEQT